MKLEVKKLTKKFSNTIAVNDISFEIKKNDTLGFLVPMVVARLHPLG